MDSALYSLGKTLLHSRIVQQHAKGVLEHMVTHQHARPQQARVRERMPPAPPAQSEGSDTAASRTEAATGVRCTRAGVIAFQNLVRHLKLLQTSTHSALRRCS
jgi:hypothetical protein